MKILTAVVFFAIGVAGVASAVSASPEIDPASGASALALLSGALILMRGRRKK